MRGCWLLLWVLAWAPCAAGNLYRCTGKQGEMAFTSSTAGYRDCKLVQTFADPPPAKPAPAPAAAGVPRVEFRSASGTAAPTPPADPGKQATVTRGAVYKYVKNGVSHYTNRPPAGVGATVLFTYIESCFACNVRSAVDFRNVALNTAAFADEVRAAARAEGVDEAFVRAVIHAESAFRPNALSNKGAQGLMQLMPATAERFGVADPFAPAQNIRGGTRYLAWLLNRFNGDTRLAAAAYNSGEGNVDKYGDVPPFAETQVFVERVGILHQRYKTALASRAAVGGTSAASP